MAGRRPAIKKQAHYFGAALLQHDVTKGTRAGPERIAADPGHDPSNR